MSAGLGERVGDMHRPGLLSEFRNLQKTTDTAQAYQRLGQWRRAPRTCRTGSKRARRGTARPAMCGSCASGLGLLRERRLPEVRNDLSVKATPSELLPIPLMGFEGGGSRAQLRKALPR